MVWWGDTNPAARVWGRMNKHPFEQNKNMVSGRGRSGRVLPVAAVVALAMLVLGSGCANRSAKRAVPAVDNRTGLSDLHPGATRTEVMAEFGSPQSSGVRADGTVTNVFQFVEGGPGKVTPQRTKGKYEEPAADKGVTVKLAQMGAVPGKVLAGKVLTVQVTYNERNQIEDTYLLSVEALAKPQVSAN